MSKRTIDLIRHGEPVGGRKIRGQTDDPLSETGWRQMRQALSVKPGWSFVAASPLSRCRAFGEEIAAACGKPLLLEPRLQEIGFGPWEGKLHDEIAAEDPERWMRFRREPAKYRPVGAEPLDEFFRRVIGGFTELYARHPGDGLVVTHAGVIRALICWVLNAPADYLFRVDVPYAGITRLGLTEIDGVVTARLVSHAWARLEDDLIY